MPATFNLHNSAERPIKVDEETQKLSIQKRKNSKCDFYIWIRATDYIAIVF